MTLSPPFSSTSTSPKSIAETTAQTHKGQEAAIISLLRRNFLYAEPRRISQRFSLTDDPPRISIIRFWASYTQFPVPDGADDTLRTALRPLDLQRVFSVSRFPPSDSPRIQRTSRPKPRLFHLQHVVSSFLPSHFWIFFRQLSYLPLFMGHTHPCLEEAHFSSRDFGLLSQPLCHWGESSPTRGIPTFLPCIFPTLSLPPIALWT